MNGEMLSKWKEFWSWGCGQQVLSDFFILKKDLFTMYVTACVYVTACIMWLHVYV